MKEKRLIFFRWIVICILCAVGLWMGIHFQSIDSIKSARCLVILSVFLNLVCFYKNHAKKSLCVIFLVETVWSIAALLFGVQSEFIVASVLSTIFGCFLLLIFHYQIRMNRKLKSDIVAIMLMLSIVFLNVCMCRSILFLKTMQDYKSIYEIETIQSPDHKKQAILYNYEYNDDGNYVMIAAVRYENGEEQNLAILEKDTLFIDMKWESGEQLEIDKNFYKVSKGRNSSSAK